MKNNYPTIITTVALALFVLLWGLVDRRLCALEERQRLIEIKVTAIGTHLGIPALSENSNRDYLFLAGESPGH